MIEIYFKNFILQVLVYVDQLQFNEKKIWRSFLSFPSFQELIE